MGMLALVTLLLWIAVFCMVFAAQYLLLSEIDRLATAWAAPRNWFVVCSSLFKHGLALLLFFNAPISLACLASLHLTNRSVVAVQDLFVAFLTHTY